MFIGILNLQGRLLTVQNLFFDMYSQGIRYVIFESVVGGYHKVFGSEKDFFAPDIFETVYKTEKIIIDAEAGSEVKTTKAALYVLR